MDKQKLITIARDQLKGGIGADQVRELLIYRGVAPEEAEAIMRDAFMSTDAVAVDAPVKEATQEVDTAFATVAQEAPVRPEYAKKERRIILFAILGIIGLIAVGSVLYWFYF